MLCGSRSDPTYNSQKENRQKISMKKADEELSQVSGGIAKDSEEFEHIAYYPNCCKPVMGRMVIVEGETAWLYHCNRCGYEYTN